MGVNKAEGFAKFNVACSGNVNIGSPQMRVVYFDQFVRLRVSYPLQKIGLELKKCARDFKGGGYNLEGTNVTGELVVMVLLIAIAYRCHNREER